MGWFGGRKTVFVDSDILVIGGGMAGCGATYEARYWGRDLNIVCVEKANIERSGAVAQGFPLARRLPEADPMIMQ